MSDREVRPIRGAPLIVRVPAAERDEAVRKVMSEGVPEHGILFIPSELLSAGFDRPVSIADAFSVALELHLGEDTL